MKRTAVDVDGKAGAPGHLGEADPSGTLSPIHEEVPVPELSASTFAPPESGQWTVDGMHAPRPMTAIGATSFGPPVESGMRQGFPRYGLMSLGIDIRFVRRFVYTRRAALVSRPPGSDTEARREFESLVAASPVLRERFRRAEEALSSRLWERDLEHWDNEAKPRLMGRTLSLTDIDPSTLPDRDLLLHLRQTVYQLERATEFHHILNPVATLPLRFFFLKASEWAGGDSTSFVHLMKGASPVSIGDEPELGPLLDALRADGGAASLLDGSEDAGDRLEQLRSRDGAVGAAARAYLRVVGHRTVGGYDAMDRYAEEDPGGLLDSIRSALQGERPNVSEDELARVRDRVPDANRVEFDHLYAEARRFARVRDERNMYCNLAAAGPVRRATLEIGRRAVAAGRIAEVEHATEASVAELAALLEGNSAPSASDLADRHAYRLAYTVNDVPAVIGEPTGEPVPLDWLPEACRTLMTAMQPIQEIQAAEHLDAPAKSLSGIVASMGTYEGPARLVLSPHDFDKIQQGDVLIAASTSPAFSILLPRLGAIVTDHGGALSHAAIIAREFGLPAVVGCGTATQVFRDGDRVRVDAETGTVQLVS